MLSEIEHIDEEDEEEPLRSECYRLAAGWDKISITNTKTLNESSNLNLIYSLMPAAAENNAFGDDF